MNFISLVESVLLLEVALSKNNIERFKKKYNTDDIKATHYIERFNNAVSVLKNKDIFGYPDLQTLEQTLNDVQAVLDKKKESTERAEKGAKVLHDSNICVVRKIETKEAAIKHGRGTTWCVSYDDRNNPENATTGNLFDEYNSIGDLYMVEFKGGILNALRNSQKELQHIIDSHKEPIDIDIETELKDFMSSSFIPHLNKIGMFAFKGSEWLISNIWTSNDVGLLLNDRFQAQDLQIIKIGVGLMALIPKLVEGLNSGTQKITDIDARGWARFPRSVNERAAMGSIRSLEKLFKIITQYYNS